MKMIARMFCAAALVLGAVSLTGCGEKTDAPDTKATTNAVKAAAKDVKDAAKDAKAAAADVKDAAKPAAPVKK